MTQTLTASLTILNQRNGGNIFPFHFSVLHLQSETENNKKMSLKGSYTTADYLPFEDYRRLVQTLIDEKRYWWATYCVLAFSTALRYSDLIRLRWRDVLDQNRIVIKAQKTRKNHVIPIGKSVAKYFEKLYEMQGRPGENGLILASDRHDGRAMSIQGVNKELKKWRDRYSLNIENFSTHTFRKTFGRYTYNKMDHDPRALLYLNRIFKHESLEVTAGYLGLRREETDSIFYSIDLKL